MKVKEEIKNRWTGRVLFEYEDDDNTIKKTVEKAREEVADLTGADLRGADLRDAHLTDAHLTGADFRDADLRGAKNTPYIAFACPSDGEFIGWKKVKLRHKFLVQLLIPKEAKRCSATGTKCRCEFAKVLAVYDLDDHAKMVSEVINNDYVKTVYRVGEMVYPDSFDEDRWNECSHGIHFFINKQEAINY